MAAARGRGGRDGGPRPDHRRGKTEGEPHERRRIRNQKVNIIFENIYFIYLLFRKALENFEQLKKKVKK